jgi:orotidine-5'-phosphate decarboxylase
MNPTNFADRLLEAIDRAGSPICAGIDPVWDNLPPQICGKGESDQERLDDVFEFSLGILKTVAPLVPVVKIQSACFERYLPDGVEAYCSLMDEARKLKLLTIGDVKRGDIGISSSSYAAGHVKVADAITVNPMLGMDTLEPYIKAASEQGRGLFVLVRTSNPGSAQLQDAKLTDGRTWSEMLAETLNAVACGQELVGQRGFSLIGAVVGATQTHTMVSLRQRLPKSIFLLPGYGAQGANAEMTAAAFDRGQGAIISASRSILYAHAQPKYASQFGDDWQRCVEQAAMDMKQEVNRVLRK